MLGLGLRAARPLLFTSQLFFARSHSSFRFALASSRSLSGRASLQPPPCYNIAVRRMAFLPFSNRSPGPTPSPRQVAEISKLEASADENPNDVQSQVQLFQRLLAINLKTGYNVVLSRWERMCEFVSSQLRQPEQWLTNDSESGFPPPSF